MSACVYSSAQTDKHASEDDWKEDIRQALRMHYIDADAETEVKKRFSTKGQQPSFLIVCDKLLTGFDAPIEAVMYLDKPLKEHSLLQAIARTNRVADASKRHGLIVDYIGVSSNLDDALSCYRSEDVKNAMRNFDDLRNQLRVAHVTVMRLMKGLKRKEGRWSKEDLRDEFTRFIAMLTPEEKWFEFRTKGRDFITAYEAVSPDPAVLEFTDDLKWVAAFLPYATRTIEKTEGLDPLSYSRKIRDMLEQHLDATGLSVTLKLRHITDPEFWDDFQTEGKSAADIHEAAIRKTTELRKTVSERMAKNPHQYGKFSERLRELLEQLDRNRTGGDDVLRDAEQMARDLLAEDAAHEGTGLSQGAYGLLQVLKSFDGGDDAAELAAFIDALYASDDTAPPLWQEKEGVRKALRQEVRKKAHAAGLGNLMQVAEQVEDFALKHFAKG
jgi:type I restriction enzyme R subunit